MNGRYLRSQELRASLYYNANGRCQSCGDVLKDGWHADHVTPWRTSQRTNVFEMQALCPDCNLRKGSRMNSTPFFDIDTTAFRPGQRQAHDVIVDRIRSNEKYTAIVLPTRYGKTDVMRVSGLRLWRDNLVSNVLIMAPDRILRDQSLNPEKNRQCVSRYRISLGHFPQIYTVDSPPKLPWLNDSAFTAITTQMATRQINILTQWVQHMIWSRGVPPVVFIDEAHTGSDENVWGDTMSQLADAGARIVLMTATPYRSDGRRIPGFDIVPELVRPVKLYKTTGEGLVDIYEGNRNVYRLKAHHVTTFRQAWDEEDPSPLCKISRQTFEVNLTEVKGLTGEFSEAKLSELSVENTKKALMPALKDPKIIKQACEFLVREMLNRQADLNGARTAAIVFVGNDSPHDDGANKHAQDVQRALSELAPQLKTLVATSNQDDAAEIVQRFSEDEGDVLIVKQMAGRGLDIARLKVCLDLSNIRTPAAFIQRMTRICTVWEQGDDPDEAIRTSTYIAPDDCLQAALFQQFVTDQRGEGLTTEITDLHLIEKGIEREQREQSPPTFYIPESATFPEEFEDTHREKAPGKMLSATDQLLERMPQMSRFFTKPYIANTLVQMGVPEDTTNGTTPSAIQEPSVGQHVPDIAKEFEEQCKRLNAVAKQLTNRLFREKWGRPYSRTHSRDWQDIHKNVWNRHKQRVGLSPSVALKNLTDLELVRRMQHNMVEELGNV